MIDLKASIKNMARVLHVASKPTSEEYWTSAKVTGVGIVLIGAAGYALFVIFTFIKTTGIF